MYAMIFRGLFFTAFFTMAVQSVSYGAISWQDLVAQPYVADTQLDLIGQSGGAWEGISVRASVDQDGTRFRVRPGNPNAFQFFNSAAIGPGESITFTFDFNMQLSSGVKVDGSNPPGRASIITRLAPRGATSDIAARLGITMLGGNSSLQSYFGSTPPVPNVREHLNSGVLGFNDTSDASVGLAHDKASFLNFSDGGNTANFSEGRGVGANTAEIAVALADPDRASNDFSYEGWRYTFTNASGTDSINANSQFFFTFEGVNAAAQSVPEPAGFLFMFFAGAVCFSRRVRL